MARNNTYPDIPSSNYLKDSLAGSHASDKVLIAPAGNVAIYGFEGRGGAAAVFVNFYDAATAAEVTPGTTPRKYQFQMAINEVVSKSIDLVFNKGCVIAFTTARGGGTASAAAAVTDINIQYHAVGG